MTTKKLIVLDLDKTLVTTNIWKEFNAALGVTDADDLALYKAFVADEITHEQWLTALKELYNLDVNKHSKEAILTYLTQYEIRSEALPVLQKIHEAGHDTLLLTGSFQITADAVAFEFGIKHAIATNRCLFDERGMFTDIASKGNERQAKLQALQTFCAEHGYEDTDCVIVGDGGNTLAILEAFPNGITFTSSSEEMQRTATHTITTLEELPQLIDTI